jgi:hypothetical protein
VPGPQPWRISRGRPRPANDCRFPRARRRLLLGYTEDGREFSLAVRGRNVLVAGDAKSGKSWVAGLLCEQLILLGYWSRRFVRGTTSTKSSGKRLTGSSTDIRGGGSCRGKVAMLIHQLPLDGVFATLRSSPAGLSRPDAAARRVEFGPKRIERIRRKPVVVRFFAQFTHFFALLLLAGRALGPDRRDPDPGEGMATLALVQSAISSGRRSASAAADDRLRDRAGHLAHLRPRGPA